MKDAWRELKRREEQSEEAPLTRKPPSAGKPSTKPKGSKKQDEADYWDTGFTIREISLNAVRVWLALQAVGLLFQVLLWNEVSTHLADYEVVVATQCAHEHLKHGVCTGPMWNLSMYQEAVLPTDRWSTMTTMNFATLSSPPTFLVAVDPLERLPEDKKQGTASTPGLLHRGVGDEDALRDAKWTLDVRRMQPPQATDHFHTRRMGREALTLEDLSEASKTELAQHGRVEWRVSLTSREPKGHGKTRYALFVEDAATPHLAEIHASTQCTFGRSWKAFNEQQQGRRHRVLAWCRCLLGLFLLVGGAAIWMVHKEVRQQLLEGGSASHRFHALVFTKFLVHDVPQQVCIMLYALGWYEASGLRCQLCLFNPTHCVYESPFHFVNMTALGMVLLSSVSNQLLIRPAYRKHYTEDDICCHYTIRITGVCVSILPLSTGVLFSSHAVLPLPMFFHIIFAAPCAIGWLSCMALLCLPLMACCEEEDL